MGKFNNWIQRLSLRKLLAITFVYNFIFWLIFALCVNKLVFGEQHSLIYYFLYPIWMSTILTTVFHWAKIKAHFKKEKIT